MLIESVSGVWADFFAECEWLMAGAAAAAAARYFVSVGGFIYSQEK